MGKAVPDVVGLVVEVGGPHTAEIHRAQVLTQSQPSLTNGLDPKPPEGTYQRATIRVPQHGTISCQLDDMRNVIMRGFVPIALFGE